MLAVDATNVYWTNDVANGTVMKVALDGTGVPVVLASAQNMPYAVAVDATNLYWTTSGSPTDPGWPDGTVMKMPLAGGEAVALASNQPGPFNLVVDATNVYWTNYDNGGPNGALMTVPLAGRSRAVYFFAGGCRQSLSSERQSSARPSPPRPASSARRSRSRAGWPATSFRAPRAGCRCPRRPPR